MPIRGKTNDNEMQTGQGERSQCGVDHQTVSDLQKLRKRFIFFPNMSFLNSRSQIRGKVRD